MTVCNCVVQEGQISPETETRLRTSLDGFARAIFGSPAQFTWTVVPKGSGFTAGEPSTSSVVAMRADAPLDQSRRVALLRELCQLWMRETGCSIDEVVGVISNPQT